MELAFEAGTNFITSQDQFKGWIMKKHTSQFLINAQAFSQHADFSIKSSIRAGRVASLCVMLFAASGVHNALAMTKADADSGEQRNALVIGNSKYAGVPLTNPENDAKAVAKALEKEGFKVDLKLNASQKEMSEAIVNFGHALKKDGVGLFYYAGHGVQIKGHNYLVPVGEHMTSEEDVSGKAVDIQQVLDGMESAKNRMNVVILDACRNNPFATASRSLGGAAKTRGGGLSQMDAPVGSIIAFATAPGSVASDGAKGNGLYTQHLLANIEQPGLRIEEVFKRVRLGVRLDSDGQQIPWESTSLEGEFFFKPGQGLTASEATYTLPKPLGVKQIAQAEKAYNFLRDNRIDSAEKDFRELAASTHPEVAFMGREGMAEISLIKGEFEQAVKDADGIIAKAPQRSAAYLIRGRALALLGQSKQSKDSLSRAVDGKTSADFSWQKANAYIAVGNAERKTDAKAAIHAYEKAARENHDSVDALSNMAVVLKDTGQAAKAISVLEKAQTLNPKDSMTENLMRQAKEALAQQQDGVRQKYVDDAVKELAARFRENKAKPAAQPSDDWTSPVMAVTVLPFQDNTLDIQNSRIGFDSVLQHELNRALQSKGIEVVERALLDKVMAELKLGSSELADQDTQIKLGKIFAARLMVSGVLNNAGTAINAGVRAIDTETTRLAMVRSDKAVAGPVELAGVIANEIAATIHEKYPLKGRVAAVVGDNIVINLGKKHGVVAGQTFNVLSKGVAIELNGRILGYKQDKIAQLTVTSTDELMSYASFAGTHASLEKNQQIIAKE